MASNDDIPWELNKKSNPKPQAECVVCTEPAHGYNFGALVCLPCKSFYIRCSKEDVIYSKCRGQCDITGENRIRCQYCRYQQCLKVGMKPREKPERYMFAFDESLCMVCGDLSNGIHFGVGTCEGCKKFFRRCLLESSKLICVNERRCKINPKTRNRCRLCRYLKCLQVGMSKSAVKIGRPRKSQKFQKQNSINAAYEDWVHTLLNNVKRHSPKPIEKDQWISTFDGETQKSASASMEKQQCSADKLSGIVSPDITNMTPLLHSCKASGELSPSKLNEVSNDLHNSSQKRTLPTRSLSSLSRSPAHPIERINMQDYDAWPLPRQRVHYNPHSTMATQAPKEHMFAKNCESLATYKQLYQRGSPNDFDVFRPVNTTSSVVQELDSLNQIYTNLVPNCGNDLGKDQYHYSYGFKYSQTDDLLNLLEDSQQLTFDSLTKSKSTSNIVSEAHNAPQNEIDERSFWNCPEDNLTQLYKSAEFLSLPNLTQLSSSSINTLSDVYVSDLSIPEFDSSYFTNDYTLI